MTNVTVGIVISPFGEVNRQSYQELLKTYATYPVVIMNQHPDQWVQTMVEESVLHYPNLSFVTLPLEDMQETILQVLPKVETPYLALVTLQEETKASYPHFLVDECRLNQEWIQLSQFVLTVEHWRELLTQSSTMMELLFSLDGKLAPIDGSITTKQTVFMNDFSLSQLHIYAQCVEQFNLSSARCENDLACFLRQAQYQNDWEKREMEALLGRLLNRDVQLEEVNQEKLRTKQSVFKKLVKMCSKVKSGRIYFSSIRQDGGQPYRLFLWLQEKYPQLDLIWEKKEDQLVEAYHVSAGSHEALKAMYTAEYLITDDWLDETFTKRKGQKVVRFLPTYPLYKLGLSSPVYQTASKQRQQLMKQQMKWWDILIVPSSWYQTEVKQDFRTNAEVIVVDFLSLPLQSVDDLKIRFAVPTDKQVILFYPQDGNVTLPFEVPQDLQEAYYWIAPNNIQAEGVHSLSDAMPEELLFLADIIVTDGNPDVLRPESRRKTILWWQTEAQQELVTKWLNVKRTFPMMTIQSVLQLRMALKFDDDPVDLTMYVDTSIPKTEELWQQITSASVTSYVHSPLVKTAIQSVDLRKYYQWVFNWLAKRPKEEIIIFESFYGRQYSDNPKALYQYIQQHYPQYQCYWMVEKGREKQFASWGVPYITQRSKNELLIQTKAKYWIVNMRLPQWKQPGEGTILLQTWHGTPLKTLGLDIKQVTMPGVTTDEYYQQFLTDAHKWDYLLAPNEYSSQIFQRAFQLPQEKIINSGYPRNDRLYHYTNDEVEAIKQKLQIKPQQKVVLYAPTWRDTYNQGQGEYYLGLQVDLDQFVEKFDDVVLLIRAHYLISESIDVSAYETVIDVSAYPDITDLYLISDVLVTDYSSVFFDYANLKRPMIFYAYDEADYADEMRGFYFDYQTVPGPIVHTNDELMTAIEKSLNEGVLQPQYQDLVAPYLEWEDGHSAQNVCHFLFDKLQCQYQTEKINQKAYLTGEGQFYQWNNNEMIALANTKAYQGQMVQLQQRMRAIDPLRHQLTGYWYYQIQLTGFDGVMRDVWVIANSLQFDVKA